MTCPQVKPQIRAYLDDLLSESAREEVRSHLRGCEACRAFSMTFGTFAGELKKIVGEIPVPKDLEDTVWEHLENPRVSSTGLDRDEKKARRRNLWKVGAIIFAGSTVLIFRFFSQNHLPSKPPEKPATQTAQTPAKREAPLPASPVLETVALKPPVVVGLHPLHWHLRFAQDRQRKNFVTALGSSGLKPDFQNSNCLVMTTDLAGFSKILRQLESAEGLSAGGLVDRMKTLPDFQGEVRISMILEAAEKGAQPEGLHWHLKLSLTNPFSLRGNLKEAGVTPIFENPEFWMFEVSEEEFIMLRSELVGGYGVAVEMMGEVTAPAGQERFPVSFYIEEGVSSV